MFELLLFAIALVGSLACGLYDLKTSNVPDSVCISMIALAILIHSVYGFTTGDFTNLINSFIFGGLFLAFGLLMYLTGQWGGGDGELLVSMGFLLPTLSFANTVFPFAISFFMNSFFIGAIYSIAYSLVLIYRNPKLIADLSDSIRNSRLPMILLGIFALSVAFLLVSEFILFILSSFIMILIFFQRFSCSDLSASITSIAASTEAATDGGKLDEKKKDLV